MKALVRRPGPLLPEGLVTHIERHAVDLDAARRQWDAYVAVIADGGWEVIEVPSADECPDAVFVEDTVVMLDHVAVICRPGAVTRRPEIDATAATLEALGYEIRRMGEPATLDGGDVLKVGKTIYIGLTERTNQAGIEQFTTLAVPLGFTVTAVPTNKVLHLKSAVTALPDGTVIGYPPLVDDPSVFPGFLGVPEEAGAHVVLIGRGRLLLSAKAVRTAELLAARGYEPLPVDISEFEKLEGCVTCLSVRLRAAPKP